MRHLPGDPYPTSASSIAAVPVHGVLTPPLNPPCIPPAAAVATAAAAAAPEQQVNNLREIQALRRLSPHPNIIKLLEVLYDQPTGRLALVFELMDMNIYELIRGRRHYVSEERVQAYMYQLVKSMDHMHRNGIFHRDIKPENILIMDECLKLADFGSCRGIYSKQPYTEYISTRWYRAPECLLTDGYYNYKMDMWGVGCVFFEIVSLFPLFPGTNELDQINKIHNVLGTPRPELLSKMKRQSAHMDFNFPPKEGSGIEKLIPHVSAECVDLIAKLLAYNPDDRLSARQALRHPYFKELRDADKRMARSSVDGAPSHASIMPRAERSLVHRSNAGNAIGAAALPTIGISSGSGKHRAEDKENAHAYGSKGSHGTHGSHGGASDIGGLSVGGSTGSKVGGHSYGHSYAGGYHSKHKHGGGGHSYGGAHKGLPLLAVGADDGAGTSGLPPIGVGGGVGSSLGAGKPGGGTFGAARKHVGGTGHSYNYSKVLMGMRPLQQKAGNSQSKVSVMRGRATMRGQQLNAGGSTSALRKPRAKAYVSPYSQAAIGERDKERERRH